MTLYQALGYEGGTWPYRFFISRLKRSSADLACHAPPWAFAEVLSHPGFNFLDGPGNVQGKEKEGVKIGTKWQEDQQQQDGKLVVERKFLG